MMEDVFKQRLKREVIVCENAIILIHFLQVTVFCLQSYPGQIRLLGILGQIQS